MNKRALAAAFSPAPDSMAAANNIGTGGTRHMQRANAVVI